MSCKTTFIYSSVWELELLSSEAGSFSICLEKKNDGHLAFQKTSKVWKELANIPIKQKPFSPISQI